MKVFPAINASLHLFSRRDRRILLLVTVAQMATSLLDLVGVLLIGAVAALSVSVVSGVAPNPLVESMLEAVGLDGVDPIRAAAVLACVAGAVLIVKSGLSVVLTRRVLRFLANRQAIVAGRLAGELLSQNLLLLQKRSSQETVYALTTGAYQATLAILAQMVIAVTETSLLVVLAVGLVLLDPLVTVFTIVYFMVVALVLQRLLSGWAGRAGKINAGADIDSYRSVQEALATYREATVSHRRSLYVERFQALRWQASAAQSDLQFVQLVPKYVFEVALVVGGGLLAYSQFLTKDITAAVATISVFLAAGSRVVPSMLRLQGAAIQVRSSAAAAAPTYQMADDLESLVSASQGQAPLSHLSAQELRERLDQGFEGFVPSIEIRSAVLTYPGAEGPALSRVSIQVEPGSSLALVGSTGAGKSTLADLLLSVLEPDSGEVLISGLHPAEAISRWPGALAYVPQEVAITAGTVRDNVALGLPGDAVDDGRVWEALQRAHLADFLREKREGLDTIVGEDGMRLSGGQRQRLGVARALYTRPRLLVLDEATSALDAETEQAVVETLQDLEGSVTTVTIAHRLATIRHCDVILYLENGRLAAAGTFDEVRRASPHFDQQAQLLGL